MPLYKVMSKNVSSVSLNSYMNLIVMCTLFRSITYVVNSVLDLVKPTNMSNRFQIRIWLANSILASIDVSSGLYTNMPHKDGIDSALYNL